MAPKRLRFHSAFVLFLCLIVAMGRSPVLAEESPAIGVGEFNAIYDKAVNLYDHNHYNESKTLATACLHLADKQKPELTIKARVLLGKCLAGLRQFTPAKAQLIEALKEMKKGRYDEAEYVAYSNDLGTVLIYANAAEEAHEMYASLNESIPSAKKMPRTLFLMGQTEYLLMDYKTARTYLEEALKVEDKDAPEAQRWISQYEIQRTLSQVLCAQGDFLKAEIHANLAYNLVPDDAKDSEILKRDALTDSGIAMFRSGDLSKAKETLEEAIELENPFYLDKIRKHIQTKKDEKNNSVSPSIKHRTFRENEPLDGSMVGIESQSAEKPMPMRGCGTGMPIGGQFISSGTPIDLRPSRTDLALGIVASRLGEIDLAIELLKELNQVGPHQPNFPLSGQATTEGKKVPGTKSKERLLWYQKTHGIEPLLLAEAIEMHSRCSLLRKREAELFPFPGLGNSEWGWTHFDTDRAFIACDVRYQIQCLGIGTSGNAKKLQTAIAEGLELTLRCTDVYQGKSFIDKLADTGTDNCDQLSRDYLTGWLELRDNKPDAAEVRLRAALKDADDPKTPKDELNLERIKTHATLLLAQACALNGKYDESLMLFESPAAWVALENVQIENDLAKLHLVSYVAAQCSEHARACKYLERIEKSKLVDERSDLRRSAAWNLAHARADAKQYLQSASDATRVLSDLDAEMTVLKKEKNSKSEDSKEGSTSSSRTISTTSFTWSTPVDHTDHDHTKCLLESKASLLRFRSVCWDKLGHPEQGLNDLRAAYDCYEQSGKARRDLHTEIRGIDETICLKSRTKSDSQSYYTKSKTHGTSRSFDFNKPVKVFLDMDSIDHGDWKADLNAISKACFKEWEKCLNKENWFTYVDERDKADVVVRLHMNVSRDKELGSTYSLPRHGCDCEACGLQGSTRCHIDLYGGFLNSFSPIVGNSLSWPEKRLLSREEKQEFRRIALHEIGHALGLHHSDSSLDVMYYASTVEGLSKRDIATVQEVYGLNAKSASVESKTTSTITTGSK